MALQKKKPEPPEPAPKAHEAKAGYGREFVFEDRGTGMTFCSCLICGAVVQSHHKALHAATH